MTKTTGNVMHEVQYLANNDKRQEAKDVIEQYAQEIAVGFAEEMERLKEEDGYEYQGDGTWLYDEGFAKKYITTPQLFQQFLTNKNEKK